MDSKWIDICGTFHQIEVYLKLKRTTFDELQCLFDSEISCAQVEWEPAYTGWGIYSELTQSRMTLGIVADGNNLVTELNF